MSLSRTAFASVAASGLLLAGLATAASADTVTVAGTTDIWLAGQGSGASVTGYFGSDTAPANAPVAITVTGATMTFSATGLTSVDASCFAGPDGGCYGDQSSFSPSPAGGLYNGPADALVGVFLNGSSPDINGWSQFKDYQVSGAATTKPQAPGLGQVFIIGSGTDGSSPIDFTVPTGATTLYLAVADSIGGSTGNLGSLSVDFTGGVAAAPEPASWMLMIASVGLMGAVLRRRRVLA